MEFKYKAKVDKKWLKGRSLTDKKEDATEFETESEPTQIINKLKKDTNNLDNINYRKKRILFKDIYIVFNETLTSSSNISDFIIRSLNKIKIPSYNRIKNNISNFKYKEINTYKDLCLYLNSGFTIIMISRNKYLALETDRKSVV